MAILGASYQIGASALAAYRAAITITGQNIANVGNPDYTRQSGRLSSMYGYTANGEVRAGTGVNLSSLQRHIDEAVESRLRMALGSRSGADTTYQALSRVEALYNELTDFDLSSQLATMFTGFSNLQTDPAEATARNLVITNANSVIRTLQRQRSTILDQVQDLNEQATALTEVANGIVQELAQLNEKITTSESTGQGVAGALRDRRDTLLRDLGSMMDIQTREQDTGIVNVYIGSEPIVDFNRTRGLTTEIVTENGIDRVTVRFADNNGTVTIGNGQLGATIAAREVHLAGQVDKLDNIAAALIYEVNRAHSSGQGLVGYTSLTGSYCADDATAALNSAGNLNFPVQNGTFMVRVRDQITGQTTTRMIQVDLDGIGGNDTTLTTLAASLNALPKLSATVTSDNRLQIKSDSGYEVAFADDSSGALASLGVATFFEGTDASSIAVNAAIRANPSLIATSASGAPGDGSNAGRIAAVGDLASALLGGVSVQDYHENVVHNLAVEVAGAEIEREAADAVYSSLLAQRESVSGVSLDEEAINLTKYERSFQGASRFLSVLDSLSAEVLSLVD